VTLLYGVLDRRTGVVAYANAGHPWPLKLAADGTVAPLSGEVGIPLGIRDPAIWSTARIALSSGDRLLLYTDGLSETANPAGDQYGEARMRERLHDLTLETSDELMRQLIAGIDDFRGAAAVVDDMTCLILDWRGPHPPGSRIHRVEVAHSA
jgi:sigma-B regulation protein RsbU (phosphoserine phosphatase)